MLLTALFCLASVLGFVLPGYLLAGWLGSGNRWLWAFPLSLVLLFWAIFAPGILGLPVVAPVVSCFLLAEVFVIVALRRWFPPRPRIDATAAVRGDLERWVIFGLWALVALVLLRVLRWPLAGKDNPFRWDFLARCILSRHNFNFYPPVTAADYRIYFYPDGIPPMVSFSYWWMYAAAGGWHPALTGLLVVAQLVAILCFTYSIGRKLHSSLAGVLSAGILGGSPLFIYSVAIGQETGLTALSVAAMFDAIVDRDDCRAMVLAGLAAALGALSREYGWIIPILGVLAVIRMRGGPRNAAILIGTAVIAALPWYARNAVHTGNPLFSNHFGPLYVNPMHEAIMNYYRGQLGISGWSLERWRTAAWTLLSNALLQCTVGVIATVLLFRKTANLGLTAAVFFVLWLDSIGYTSGGWDYAARVLPPALLALSVPAGIFIAGAGRRWFWNLLLAAAMVWSFLAAAILPYQPALDTLRQLPGLAFSSKPSPQEWWFHLPEIIPRGSRVLCNSAYIHAGLVASGIDFVPVWSPEVAFLAEANLLPLVIRKDLLDRGIRYVIVGYDIDGRFLASHVRFYSQDMRFWKVIGLGGQATFVCKIPLPTDWTPAD
jgi:hypothetical protein